MTTRLKLFVLVALLLLTSCSLIFNPRATAKSFLDAADKGDVDKMTALFSKRAVEHFGIEKIRSNNQSFADNLKRDGGSYRMEIAEESSIPSGQRVALVYRNKSESISLVFDLSKDGYDWKIDNIGGPELKETVEQPADTPTDNPVEPPPIPSPEAVETISPDSQSTLKTATISGGVLNGKAVSLPKPPYPPIARAAKAGGTVVVQVLVDENGNVAEAHAVSGHPLLQAASVAAARQAKFTPTKLNGQPVKVKGVVTYNFIPE